MSLLASLKKREFNFLLNPRLPIIIYVLLAAFATIHQYNTDAINNYKLFTRVFWLLLDGENMYVLQDKYYYDIYKYSPAFATIIGSLVLLPDLIGLMIWNMLNIGVFIYAFHKIFADRKMFALVLWILMQDSFTSLKNCQSNCLLAGLIILTFAFLEEKKPVKAALVLSLGAFIKIYGIAAAALAIFYKEKWKMGLATVVFFVVLIFIPLMVVSWDAFIMNYKAWHKIVTASQTLVQLSIMGILESWTGLPIPHRYVQLGGLVLLLLPLLNFSLYKEHNFRKALMCSILIFLVIFNQMSESPTFVIAASGFAIWFLSVKERDAWDYFLFGFMLLFVSFYHDLLPRDFRKGFYFDYKLKALPMVLIWFTMQYYLINSAKFKSKFGIA